MTNLKIEKKHKHKRIKGLQFCACGYYMGHPRKFVTLSQLKALPINLSGEIKRWI